MQIVGQFPPGRLPPVHFQPRTFPTLDSSQPLAYREGGGGGTTHFWPPPSRYAITPYTGHRQLSDTLAYREGGPRIFGPPDYWILASLHSVRYELVIVTQCMCALGQVLNFWILAPLHSMRYRSGIVTQCMCALAWVCLA